MESFYFSLNPQPERLTCGNSFQFWMLSGIGLLLGICVFLLLTRPSLRRSPFQTLGRTSPMTAAAIALMLGGSIITMAYGVNWMQFYRLDVENGALHVQYFYPERAFTARRAEIKSLNAQWTHRGRRILVIELQDGSRHTSQETSERHFQEEMWRLTHCLQWEETGFGNDRERNEPITQ